MKDRINHTAAPLSGRPSAADAGPLSSDFLARPAALSTLASVILLLLVALFAPALRMNVMGMMTLNMSLYEAVGLFNGPTQSMAPQPGFLGLLGLLGCAAPAAALFIRHRRAALMYFGPLLIWLAAALAVANLYRQFHASREAIGQFAGNAEAVRRMMGSGPDISTGWGLYVALALTGMLLVLGLRAMRRR